MDLVALKKLNIFYLAQCMKHVTQYCLIDISFIISLRPAIEMCTGDTRLTKKLRQNRFCHGIPAWQSELLFLTNKAEQQAAQRSQRARSKD